jgi:16S rRNA (guanine966-N2)-methyltransferase
LVRSLQATQAKLGASAVKVECADAIGWLARAPADSFDLAFIDPPFDTDLAAGALQATLRLMRDNGYIYLESRSPLAAPPEGWAIHRQSRAGQVHFHLLSR